MPELTNDEERRALGDSLGRFLADCWPAARALEASQDAASVARACRGLAEQGLATLCHPDGFGGARELTIAMEALGRAACPAPLLGAALANLWLGGSVRHADGDGDIHALLGDVADGTARLAVAFGPVDADPGAGAVDRDPGGTLSDNGGRHQGTVSGCLRFVDAAHACSHLLTILPDRRTLAIVVLDGRIQRVSTRALGADGLHELRLERATARLVALSPEAIADGLKLARLALLARAHGAARRAFELVVDYARDRVQFGQPIGRFQAIQHKLANGLIDLEGSRLVIDHAAAAHDIQDRHWRYHASAAAAFAGVALRRVSLETHHAFGAIGYAEEHEAPRHFKRVHLDTLALGGPAQARREVAAHLFAGGGNPLPEYDLGDAGNRFRQEVRDWFASHWSGERKAAFDARPHEEREFDREFAEAIGRTGWIGLGWPVSHGGQGRGPLEQLAFMEMLERFDAPRIGAAIQANALMMFGTEVQQRRYLPEILRGEAMHGMGYSEPQAGSDLASLKTRATRVGDRWRIDGQKIWTTTWWGRYMFLAARTDPQAAPAHAGISLFIVPMDAPGITIKPAKTMYDGTFANIFYDGVHVDDDALIGPLNGGWKVLTAALAFERGLVGGGIVLKVLQSFEKLRALLLRDHGWSGEDQPIPVPRSEEPVIQDRMATLAAEIEVGRQLMRHCADLAVDGMTPPALAAISKVFSGELMERFGEAALEILGLRGALSQGSPAAICDGRFEQGLRHSLMWVISIGTNEIQRSLIAQRGLGLPR